MGKTKPEFKLVIFDMDGVLTDHISSWMYVHNHFGVDNEDGYGDYRAGRIDDLEFMSRDIRLWRQKHPDVTADYVKKVLDSVPLVPGVQEVFKQLKKKGILTAIISGGLDSLSHRIGKKFDIDFIRSNGLETGDNGLLTGEGILRVPLKTKEDIVRKIVSKAGVTLEETAAVGDTRIDADMLKMCKLGIAFDPKDEAVMKSADVVIPEKNLARILKYII